MLPLDILRFVVGGDDDDHVCEDGSYETRPEHIAILRRTLVGGITLV